MKPRIRVSPLAAQDSEDLFVYFAIDCKDVALARRFNEAVAETVLRIQDAPRLGIQWFTSNQRLTDLRWKRVRGFKRYLIFYRYDGNVIDIVRILHGARNLDSFLP